MLDYGLKSVIDLRTKKEADELPSVFVSPIPVRYQVVSMLADVLLRCGRVEACQFGTPHAWRARRVCNRRLRADVGVSGTRISTNGKEAQYPGELTRRLENKWKYKMPEGESYEFISDRAKL